MIITFAYKTATGEATNTKRKQKMLLEFKTKPCSPDRANGITDWIVEFVAQHLWPITTVDGAGFNPLGVPTGSHLLQHNAKHVPAR